MSKTTATDRTRPRHRLAAILAALALAMAGFVTTAAPAMAATYWASYLNHKPKTLVCAWFQNCREIKHCHYGHPTKAATTWADARKVYCHTDRY